MCTAGGQAFLVQAHPTLGTQLQVLQLSFLVVPGLHSSAAKIIFNQQNIERDPNKNLNAKKKLKRLDRKLVTEEEEEEKRETKQGAERTSHGVKPDNFWKRKRTNKYLFWFLVGARRNQFWCNPILL